MEKATGRILKANDVKLEGRFRLDAGQTPQTPASESSVPLSTPQVHIVENYPEFAVIEVTCCCGAKTRIKCEYTGVQSTEQSPDQTK